MPPPKQTVQTVNFVEHHRPALERDEGPDVSAPPGWTSIDALAPLTPAAYAAQRPILLGRNTDRLGTRSRKEFEATVPESFTDALAVETSAIQDARWSQPPVGRIVRYARPEVGPRPPAAARPRRAGIRCAPQTVARLILAGRPMPPITEAVRIGEVFRRALIARCSEAIPSVLSGRDGSGQPLREPAHAHAFFLPEDHDQDGLIDHLMLYARQGLDQDVRRALEGLSRLWIADRRSRSEEEDSEADGPASGGWRSKASARLRRSPTALCCATHRIGSASRPICARAI